MHFGVSQTPLSHCGTCAGMCGWQFCRLLPVENTHTCNLVWEEAHFMQFGTGQSACTSLGQAGMAILLLGTS